MESLPPLTDPFTTNSRVVSILQRICLPTAPFHEHFVAKAVIEQAESIRRHPGVAFYRDRIGNLILAYQPQTPRNRTIVFAAHLDHPGFLVRVVEGNSLRLRKMGGLPAEFCVGAKVRVYDLMGEFRLATITECKTDLIFIAEYTQPAPEFAARFAVLDLELFSLANGLISGLAMDDLAGCAMALAAFEELVTANLPITCLAIFHRAEEIGFLGAAALATSGLIPEATLFVSLEASKTVPGAEINQGPVVRVGDKRYIFDPNAELYLDLARTALIAKGLMVQKRVMPGGTCEASIYRAVGFASAGVAVPLLNYHNTGTDSVAAETIGVYDLNVGVDLLCECAVHYATQQRLVYAEFLAESLDKVREADSLFTSYLDPTVQELPLLREDSLKHEGHRQG